MNATQNTLEASEVKNVTLWLEHVAAYSTYASNCWKLGEAKEACGWQAAAADCMNRANAAARMNEASK